MWEVNPIGHNAIRSDPIRCHAMQLKELPILSNFQFPFSQRGTRTPLPHGHEDLPSDRPLTPRIPDTLGHPFIHSFERPNDRSLLRLRLRLRSRLGSRSRSNHHHEAGAAQGWGTDVGAVVILPEMRVLGGRKRGNGDLAPRGPVIERTNACYQRDRGRSIPRSLLRKRKLTRVLRKLTYRLT